VKISDHTSKGFSGSKGKYSLHFSSSLFFYWRSRSSELGSIDTGESGLPLLFL